MSSESQPSGPRVLVNQVGPDGKTDAERGMTYDEYQAESPTWAEIASAAPKTVDGKQDLDAVFGVMRAVTGNPNVGYKDLSVSEKYEVIERVRAQSKTQSPKTESSATIRGKESDDGIQGSLLDGDAGSSAADVQPASQDRGDGQARTGKGRGSRALLESFCRPIRRWRIAVWPRNRFSHR